MSDDPTRILPNDASILQQILIEVRELRTEVRAIDQRLTVVEEKIDARSRETQPMSGRIDQLILDVAETRQEMRAGLAEIRDEAREHRLTTQRELRGINRTLQGINLDLANSIEAQDDLHKRVAKIEEQLEIAK